MLRCLECELKRTIRMLHSYVLWKQSKLVFHSTSFRAMSCEIAMTHTTLNSRVSDKLVEFTCIQVKLKPDSWIAFYVSFWVLIYIQREAGSTSCHNLPVYSGFHIARSRYAIPFHSRYVVSKIFRETFGEVLYGFSVSRELDSSNNCCANKKWWAMYTNLTAT